MQGEKWRRRNANRSLVLSPWSLAPEACQRNPVERRARAAADWTGTDAAPARYDPRHVREAPAAGRGPASPRHITRRLLDQALATNADARPARSRDHELSYSVAVRLRRKRASVRSATSDPSLLRARFFVLGLVIRAYVLPSESEALLAPEPCFGRDQSGFFRRPLTAASPDQPHHPYIHASLMALPTVSAGVY